MDKLGATARLNYSRVFRQTFVGGYYGLLNNSYQPVPVSCATVQPKLYISLLSSYNTGYLYIAQCIVTCYTPGHTLNTNNFNEQ